MNAYTFNGEDIKEQVLDFMNANEAEPAENLALQLDGQTHRYRVKGDKHGAKSGAYCIFLDNWPAGWIQNWRVHSEVIKWKYNKDSLDDNGKKYFTSRTYKEALALSEKRQAELKLIREKEQAEASEKARILAETLTAEVPYNFPYLEKKGITKQGNTRYDKSNNALVVPLNDISGNIKSLQYIYEDGSKKFYYDAPTKGLFFLMNGDMLEDNTTPILVGEGYATCATIALRMNYPVIAAMTCHNLLPVCQAFKEKYPDRKIILMADNDHKTKGNPGLTTAENVKKELNLPTNIVFPHFEDNEDGTDWNDYYKIHGWDNTREVLSDRVSWAALTDKERKEFEENTKAKKKLDNIIYGLNPEIALPPQEFVGGIFPKKFVTIIAAAPGTGKTMLMQWLASDLSMGGTILKGVAENEPERKVLIFAGEAGFHMLIRRGAYFKWPINPDNVKVVDQHVSEMQEMSVMLDEEEGKKHIEWIIEKHKPDIVYWDTFSSFHDKDENKATEIKPLIRNIATLADKYNFAAVLNHHSRKRLAKERNLTLTQDDVIGSSIFNRLAALIIGIEKDEDDIETNGKKLKVRPLKTWFSAFKSFDFTIEEGFYGTTEMNIDLNPKDANKSRDSVWNYLASTFKPGEWFSYSQIILSEIKPAVSEKRVRKNLADFVQTGKLQQRGTTRNTEYSIP